MNIEYYMQQDPALNANLIRIGSLDSYGCYVCSVINGIMNVTGKQIDRPTIIKACIHAFEKGYLKKDFFIEQPNAFVKCFDTRFYYIGFGEVRDADNRPNAAFAIECWDDDRPQDYKHFKLSFWDSYKGGTQTNRGGRLHSYRIYGMER